MHSEQQINTTQELVQTQLSTLREARLTFGKHAAIIDANIGIASCNRQLMGSGLQMDKTTFQTLLAGDGLQLGVGGPESTPA